MGCRRREKKVEKPCKWTLDGMSDPGVYPIKPWRREWFLDQKRDKPMLSVKVGKHLWQAAEVAGQLEALEAA